MQPRQAQRQDDLTSLFRQRIRTGWVAEGVDLQALSARLDVMRLPEQTAVLDLAERMLSAGVDRTRDGVRGWIQALRR